MMFSKRSGFTLIPMAYVRGLVICPLGVWRVVGVYMGMNVGCSASSGLPTPSLPHVDDPQVYIPSKPALLYCPSSLRVDPFLLPSAVPKPPRLLLLLEVKLVHTVDSKRWFKQGRKWESCSMNLGLGSKRKRGKVVDTGYPTGLLVERMKKA